MLKIFLPRLSLYVPWNEVMVLSPVKLTRREVHVQLPELYNPIPTCTQHDYNKMQPIVQTSWHPYTRGGSGTGAGILSESRVLRESLEIPGSNINLVYTSSRAKETYNFHLFIHLVIYLLFIYSFYSFVYSPFKLYYSSDYRGIKIYTFIIVLQNNSNLGTLLLINRH